MNMPPTVPLWSKMVSGFLGIFFTVATAIVTVVLWNDHRMDEKDEKVKKDLIHEMDTRKEVRIIEMKGMEDRLIIKLDNTNAQVAEVKETLKEIRSIGRDIRRKVTIVQEPTDLYTKTKSKDSKIEGSL